MPTASRDSTSLIRRLSGPQHGVATRAQLLAAGLPGRAIDGRLESGWLLTIVPGIYAVGRPVSTESGALTAALLAAGTGAVLARRSAAAHWGLSLWPGAIEVLRPESRVPPRFRLGQPGLSPSRPVFVRRSRHLDDFDITRHQGIPVTSVARTLLDLAGILNQQRLRAAFNEADRRGLLRADDLRDCAARGSGWAGVRRFRELVELRDPSVRRTRLELESIFLDTCREYGFPAPAVNQRVAGLEVDCFWPEHRLVVELDGFAFHRSRMAVINDSARDNRLRRSGFRVVRFPYDMVVSHPADMIDQLKMELRG